MLIVTTSNAMQIFIRDAGTVDSSLDVEPSEYIEDIRQKYFEEAGIPNDLQTLSFEGTTLQDGKTLSDYNIRKEDIINFAFYISDSSAVNKTWDSTTILDVVLNDVSGTKGENWSHTALSGDLTITATADNPLTIRLWSSSLTHGGTAVVSNWDSDQSYVFEISSVVGAIQGFSPDAFIIDSSHFQNDLDGGTFAIQEGSIDLVFSSIPEPTTLTLFLAGVLVLRATKKRF